MPKDYYFYTKWKFKTDHVPEGLDHVGPYHSTWKTSSPPKEILEDTLIDSLEEFFIKQFQSDEEMQSYWRSLNK